MAFRLSENKCKFLDLDFVQDFQWIIPVLCDSGERFVCAEGSELPVVWARNHCCAVERCSGSCEHVPLHPSLLYSDCRVPEQTGGTWCVAALLQGRAEHKQGLKRDPKQEKGYWSCHTSLLHTDGRAVLVTVIARGREKRNLSQGQRDEEELLLRDWPQRLEKSHREIT